MELMEEVQRRRQSPKRVLKGHMASVEPETPYPPPQPTKGFVGSSVVSSPNVIRGWAPAKKNDFGGPTAF